MDLQRLNHFSLLIRHFKSLNRITMKCFILTFLFIFGYCFLNSHALPGGAPIEACKTLVPDHNGTKPSEYEKAIAGAYIKDGDVLVNIQMRPHLAPSYFKGFIVQARPSHDPEAYETIGRFVPLDLSTQVFRCQREGDTGTHTINVSTITSLFTLKWIPPAGFSNVTFR